MDKLLFSEYSTFMDFLYKHKDNPEVINRFYKGVNEIIKEQKPLPFSYDCTKTVEELQASLVFDWTDYKNETSTDISFSNYVLIVKKNYEKYFRTTLNNFTLAQYGIEEIKIRSLKLKNCGIDEVQNSLPDFDVLQDLQNEIQKNERDFYNSAKMILNYLDEILQNEKINLLRFQNDLPQPQQETPVNDFSDSEPKERVILLEKLGIIDFVKSLQDKPDTISHTAEILSGITGIDSKTIYSYILPMLQPNRNDIDKNSPYKNPDNLLQANKKIMQMRLKPNALRQIDTDN